MKRISLVSLYFIILLTPIISCSPSRPDSETVLVQTSLRLNWIPSATHVGDYVAKVNGYWNTEGINVSIETGGFEYDAIKLVSTGINDFGITSGAQLIQARANGIPVVAIGTTIPNNPIGWVSKKESGIIKPIDFIGKKIGGQFGTHTEITLEALCAKEGIDLESFERIPIKFDPRPFVVGEIDVLPCYLIDQPIDLEREGINLNYIDPNDYGIGLAYGNLYFTTEEIIEKNPSLVKSFLKGSKKAWLWTYNNREKAVDLFLSANDGNDSLNISNKLSSTLSFIMKDRDSYQGVFPFSLERWENTYQILERYERLENSIELNSCFTNKYLE